MTAMTSESNMGQFHNMPPNNSLLSSQAPLQHHHHIPISHSHPHHHSGSSQPPLLSSLITSFPSASASPNTSSLLKLSNVPSDISKREATLMFSLVIDELVSIEINDFVIYAYFKNINTCLTAAKLLDGKYVFGNEYPPVKVDYDSLSSPPQNTAFNSMRLSNSNISPPHLNPQLHHQSSSASIPTAPQSQTAQSQQQPQPQSQQQPQQQPQQPQSSQQSSNGGVNSTANAANAAFDNFQKRQSIGNQRSRFVFSDPFSGPASGATSNALTPSGTSNPPSAAIDLSDLTGKSILLMESQNDAREYDNLVRDPWGSTPSSANPNGQNLPLSSAPQTPGLNNNHSSFDWSTANHSNASSSNPAASNGSNANSNNPGGSNINGTQSTDRRRTSSAFFNNNSALHSLSTQPTTASILANQQPQQSQQPPQQQQSQQQPPQQQQPQQQPQPPALGSHPTSTTVAQGPTAAGILSAQQQQSQPQPGSQPSLQGATTGLSNLNLSTPASAAKPQAATAISGTKQQSTPTSSVAQSSPSAVTSGQQSASSSRQSSSSKDVPDLSLLARVPPPANPADQNPPCNTLYVGNLPPDATEAELRALFSPQKGFRRLSFRTKNQSQSGGPSSGSSNHNHGPMCFVEFEDVAHATRALAELYGRALPRPNGSNGKGGIRLSFSKNPLGVRGPGNPRRTSTNQLPTASSSSTSVQGNISSNNGVGNYGYSSYQK